LPREIVSAGGTRFVEFEPRAHVPAGSTVEVLPATAFEPEAIDWLWPNWLACGKLHLLAGAAGTGKTTIALSLAASLSRGGAWPDGAPIEPADVVIWTGEDGIADTLLPRLLVAGGNPRPVATVELREAANAHGHAWRTLQRIKDDLDIVATKAGL
jgi:RecA-family ATPase